MGYTSGAELPSGRAEGRSRQASAARLAARGRVRVVALPERLRWRARRCDKTAMACNRDRRDAHAGRLCSRGRTNHHRHRCGRRHRQQSAGRSGTALSRTQAAGIRSALPRPPPGDPAAGQHRPAGHGCGCRRGDLRRGRRRRLSVRAGRNRCLRMDGCPDRPLVQLRRPSGVRAGGRGRLSMDEGTVAPVGARRRVPRERRRISGRWTSTGPSSRCCPRCGVSRRRRCTAR